MFSVEGKLKHNFISSVSQYSIGKWRLKGGGGGGGGGKGGGGGGDWGLVISFWIITSCQAQRFTSGRKWVERVINRTGKLTTIAMNIVNA